MVLRQ